MWLCGGVVVGVSAGVGVVCGRVCVGLGVAFFFQSCFRVSFFFSKVLKVPKFFSKIQKVK